MSKKEVVLHGRQSIAEFFKVSRMTLYRWEKIHPLPTSGFYSHYYDVSLNVSVLKSWLKLLDEKIDEARQRRRYNRPY